MGVPRRSSAGAPLNATAIGTGNVCPVTTFSPGPDAKTISGDGVNEVIWIASCLPAMMGSGRAAAWLSEAIEAEGWPDDAVKGGEHMT